MKKPITFAAMSLMAGICFGIGQQVVDEVWTAKPASAAHPMHYSQKFSEIPNAWSDHLFDAHAPSRMYQSCYTRIWNSLMAEHNC